MEPEKPTEPNPKRPEVKNQIIHQIKNQCIICIAPAKKNLKPILDHPFTGVAIKLVRFTLKIKRLAKYTIKFLTVKSNKLKLNKPGTYISLTKEGAILFFFCFLVPNLIKFFVSKIFKNDEGQNFPKQGSV